MACLRCGRETDHTFCELCRAEMEKYPVKPDAIILLPKRKKASSARKAPHYPAVPLEARIQMQHKLIRGLSLVIVGLVLLLLALGSATYNLYKSGTVRPVGQNYSTVKPTEESIAVSSSNPR